MNNEQVLILDCHGEARPAVCFNLEVAGYGMRVVTDEREAINLLDNARMTNEKYLGLLVNNPYLNVDISKLVEEVDRIDLNIPVLFVKESASLKKMVQNLSIQCRTRIYHVEPTRVADLLAMFGNNGVGGNSNSSPASAG